MEDLKELHILHKEFPRTLPEFRRGEKLNKPSQYNTMRGDKWYKQEQQKDVRDERQWARGVLLYFEERYKQVDEKIPGFDSFPEEIQVVLDKYIDVFDTKQRKSMNVEPVHLNVKEGSKPYACFSCRPAPTHYRETGRKPVQGLLDLRIIQRSGEGRSEYCAPAHFVEKPGKVPQALCLVVDFTRLNEQLICNQPQVFSTGEEIRQQLGPDCCVWICLDALAAYFQIKVGKEDWLKTTFMLHSGRYFFRKTVMGNRLSSDAWLRSSDEVIERLEGVYKLVDDLIIGGKDYVQLAERLEALLMRCRKAGMTLTSNKV